MKVKPQNNRIKCSRRRYFISFCWFLFVFLVVISSRVYGQNQPTVPMALKDDWGTIRINITWSSVENGLWDGSIVLSSGSFSDSVSLGKDPLSPILFNLNNEKKGNISFQTARSVLFCGLQTTLHTDPKETLSITINNRNTGTVINKTISIEQILKSSVQIAVPSTISGILIEQAAGDVLPVKVARVSQEIAPPFPLITIPSTQKIPSMVFEPGESFHITVQPRLNNIQPHLELMLSANLTMIGENNVNWTDCKELPPDQLTKVDFTVQVPDREGVFELVFNLLPKNGTKQGFSFIPNPWDSKKGTVLASRTIQGVAIRSKSVSDQWRNKEQDNNFDLRNGLVETIDPSNPSWWKIFAKKPLFGKQTSIPSATDTTIQMENRVDSTNGVTEDMVVRAQQSSVFPFLKKDYLKIWKKGGLQLNLMPWRSSTPWGQWDEFWRQSRGSGHLHPYNSKDPLHSSFMELRTDKDPEVIPWESYTIPIHDPGQAHLLEIEYISNVPQTLGVSIIEPAASGGIFPRTLDYGLTVSENPFGDNTSHRIMRFQVPFWPKTKTPTILLMNRDKKHSAVFGRIQLYRAKEDGGFMRNAGRKFAAFMTRPTLCEQFAAIKIDSPFDVTGVENWTTFYQAVDRMSNYLKMGGYNTLLISSVADGSTIYPSRCLNPSPKYDSGIFLSRGEDPVRKDVLELVARTFDREQLTFIPHLDLNSPLPKLEANLAAARISGNQDSIRWTEGIYSIGPEGILYGMNYATPEGTGPWYNILHPLVQQAVAEIIHELVERYGGHESFGGLAIELSVHNYMQLPDDIYYGMDDYTITKFVRDTNLTDKLKGKDNIPLQQFLTAVGMERYRFRAQFIKDYCQEDWIQWRAESVFQFYSQLGKILTERRPDTQLYMTGTEMLYGEQSRYRTWPQVLKTTPLQDALRMIGIVPELISRDNTLVLLRPGGIAATTSLNKKVQLLEFDSPENIALFAKNPQRTGSLFIHNAEGRNIPGFDQKSPYRPTITDISTRAIPADFENRRRFAHQLAVSDTLAFFDGGEMLPMGGENTLAEWISVYRSLPAIPFECYSPLKTDTPENKETVLQPITVRYKKVENNFWVYLVNDAPFHTGVNITIQSAPTAKAITYSGSRSINDPVEGINTMNWTLSLQPFDLIAFQITDPNALITKVEVSRPDELCGTKGYIAHAVQNYIDRILIARQGITQELKNGNFEESVHGAPVPSGSDKTKKGLNLDITRINLLKNPFASSEKNDTEKKAVKGEPVPGWRRFGSNDFIVELDSVNHSEGDYSVKLSGAGNVGGIVSAPFAAPTTGRLCVQMSFGIPRETMKLPLRLCLIGRYHGKPYQRQVDIGSSILNRIQNGRKTGLYNDTNSVLWTEDVILFDRLPLEGLENISLRFDMLGEGTVWLDHTRIYSLILADLEQKELMRFIQTVDYRVNRERVEDSLNLLNTYWALLLQERIPDDSPLMTKRPTRPDIPLSVENQKKEKEPEKEAKGFFGRMFQW